MDGLYFPISRQKVEWVVASTLPPNWTNWTEYVTDVAWGYYMEMVFSWKVYEVVDALLLLNIFRKLKIIFFVCVIVYPTVWIYVIW